MQQQLHAFLLRERENIQHCWLEQLAFHPRGDQPAKIKLVHATLDFLQRRFATPAAAQPDLSFVSELPPSGTLDLVPLTSWLREGQKAVVAVLSEGAGTLPEKLAGFQALEEAFATISQQLLYRCEKRYQANAALECPVTPEVLSRLNLLNAAFKHSTDGIIITDLRGTIIEANQAFLNLFGYARTEVIGHSTSILRSSQTSDAFYEAMWQSINTRGEWKGEIVNRAKSGQEIPVWLSITPILEEGNLIGYLGIEIDLRRQKQLEKELLKAERLALIGQMAANVAHEIRNPLSSISLNTELLEDEIHSLTAEEGREAQNLLRRIGSEIERLSDLVEEYLHFSRLPRANLQRGDLLELISEVLAEFEPLARSAGVSIIRRCQNNLPEILFDPQQLRRAMLNVLRNAVEAMPEGGRLILDIQTHENWVHFKFVDTGHGIAGGDLGKIFEPFHTTKPWGTGLGLPLVQQIIKEHGGTVACESRVGSGTTLCFQLPVSAEFQTSPQLNLRRNS